MLESPFKKGPKDTKYVNIPKSSYWTKTLHSTTGAKVLIFLWPLTTQSKVKWMVCLFFRPPTDFWLIFKAFYERKHIFGLVKILHTFSQEGLDQLTLSWFLPIPILNDFETLNITDTDSER